MFLFIWILGCVIAFVMITYYAYLEDDNWLIGMSFFSITSWMMVVAMLIIFAATASQRKSTTPLTEWYLSITNKIMNFWDKTPLRKKYDS